jgi:tetratricopeptide (TPR) repeat protein
LPLALHLAGGFLRRYRQVSPARYLAQLREQGLLQHPSLRGRGLSYSPTGHELDVSRTFATSLAQLDPADEIDETARQLLARAACFAPGEAIPQHLLQATVFEGGIGDNSDIMNLLLAEDGLARLIVLGFLRSEGSGRVVMHRLLAAFTAEFLVIDTDVQMEVENALLQTLVTHSERGGHLGTLPFSAIHLQHVTHNTLARPDGGAFRLGILLGAHLREIGDLKNARSYLVQALAAAETAGDGNGQAEALIWLAKAQEDLQETFRYAEQAEQLLRSYEAADQALLAAALHYKGWALYQMGQAGAALAAAEEGLTLSVATNRRELMGEILNLMGMITYYVLGRYGAALRYLDQALVIFREVGNRHAESMVLNNMGECARVQGDYASAVDLYQQAIDIAHDAGNSKIERFFRTNHCGALVGLEAYDVAVSELEKLIPAATVNWRMLSEAHRFLAEARLGQGEDALALMAARRALALGVATNVFYDIGRAWRVLGQIAARLARSIRVRERDDRRYDAPACFAKSVEIFTDTEMPRDRALALWQWAEYKLSQDSATEGRKMFQEARGIFKRLNLPLLVARMDSAGE